MHTLFPHPADASGPLHGATSGNLRQTLADAQERHGEAVRKASNLALSVRYSVMFELTAALSMTETLRVIRDHARNSSIHEVIGFSAGEKEDSIIVDVIASPEDKATIIDLARMLKHLHHQQSVLVSWSTVNSLLI